VAVTFQLPASKPAVLTSHVQITVPLLSVFLASNVLVMLPFVNVMVQVAPAVVVQIDSMVLAVARLGRWLLTKLPEGATSSALLVGVVGVLSSSGVSEGGGVSGVLSLGVDGGDSEVTSSSVSALVFTVDGIVDEANFDLRKILVVWVSSRIAKTMTPAPSANKTINRGFGKIFFTFF